MRDLASAAGLNVASLYHYFPSKRDLLESVLIEQGFLPIRPVQIDPEGVTPPAEPLTLAQLLAEIMTSMFEVEDFVRLMVGEAMRGEATARASASTSSPPSRPALRTGSRTIAPTSTRDRAPLRWPGSSAPWWSGSSFSTPPMCSVRKGMTSPPCPSTGPARRPPSSGRRSKTLRVICRSRPPGRTLAPCPTTTPTAAPTAVASAVFSVPAETVWAYRLDFANLPGYNPDVSGVTRIADGAADDVGGVHGPGARYTFGLADLRRPGVTADRVVDRGGRRADARDRRHVGRQRRLRGIRGAAPADGGSEATLTLWVTLPDGLSDEVVAAAAAGSLASISKELRLMQQNLDGDAPLRRRLTRRPQASAGCNAQSASARRSASRANILMLMARRRRQHRPELTRVEDQQLHVRLGDDVRRADPAVEERQLAEVPARS